MTERPSPATEQLDWPDPPAAGGGWRLDGAVFAIALFALIGFGTVVRFAWVWGEALYRSW